MKNRLTFIALAAAGTCAFAAVNLPKEGTYETLNCWTGTGNDVAVGKDYTASSYEMVGTVVSVPPGGLGDRSTFRCVGYVTTFKGKPPTNNNVCVVTDADGDQRINRFAMLPDGKFTREMIGGTGKYEGMEMTNTVFTMPPMKEAKPGVFQGCNRQTGTYKLK
jgi:hypothetical protein